MDFAICPACGQSVLDDDAVDCPFCGASMKAKSGSKPAAAPPASKPVAKPAAKPASPAKKPAEDDFPFDPQTNLPQSAVAASAAPSKGRSLKVICPMCETTGYVPPSAAGKNVKCANPKCMVPVFTAPAPEPEAPPPPPPKPKSNLLLLGAGTAAAVGLVGGLVYFIAMQPTNRAPQTSGLLTEEQIRELAKKDKSSTGEPPAGDPGQTTPTPEGPDQPPAVTDRPAATSPQALIARALDESYRISITSTTNRNRAYTRRLSAETFALGGNTQGAQDQLEAFSNVDPRNDVPFFRIGPWVELFWQAQSRSDAAAAGRALDKALADAAKLPTRGRDQLDLATRLAVALIVAGRADEAATLIAGHQSADADGELSAWLMWLGADRGRKQPQALFDLRPAVPRLFPQTAAVVAVVTLRGHPDEARQFALKQTDLDARAEAVSAWAEALIWTQPPDQTVSTIQQAVADLPPASTALVWARACRAAAAIGEVVAAKQFLASAQSALEETPPPESYLIPNRETLAKARPQFDDMHRRAALAAAELALMPAALGSDPLPHLETALQYARGLGPSVPAIKRLIAEADSMSLSNMTALIKRELNLRTDDDARQKLGQYRRALTDLDEAAQRRLALQTTILTRAARTPLASAIWLMASARSTETDLNRQERFLQTDLAGVLIEAFRATGQSDLERAVTAAVAAEGVRKPERPTADVFRELLRQRQFDKAWGALTRAGAKSDMQDPLILEAAVHLGATDPAAAWTLIGPVSNPVLREQALEWAALMATRNGQERTVTEQVKSLTQATEILSLYRGLVAGLRDVAGL